MIGKSGAYFSGFKIFILHRWQMNILLAISIRQFYNATKHSSLLKRLFAPQNTSVLPAAFSEKQVISMKKILSNEDTQLKIIFTGIVIVLLVTLIPLYIISHYNFMSMDDVGYATDAEELWAQTHSVLKVCLLYTSPSPRDRG